MLMRSGDLAAHLAPGRMASIYVLHGEEMLVVLESAQAIRDAARAAGFGEREVLTVESGFKWAELAHAGSACSLFAERKLIELRIPSGKPGTDGGEALQRYAASASADNVLMVQLPKLEKVQTQSKWFLALDSVGVSVACAALGRAELGPWMAERLARQGQRLAPDAMELLVARVEGNLLAARQEIDKLALLYPQGEVGLDQLRHAVADVARYDVWGMGEALVAGDSARFARMLAGLHGEGEAPNLVLWAMADEIRSLLRVGLGRAQGTPLPQLFRDCRVYGSKQRLYPAALDRLKASQLKSALAHAAEVDRVAKGIGRGDVWEELLQLGMRLMPVRQVLH